MKDYRLIIVLIAAKFIDNTSFTLFVTTMSWIVFCFMTALIIFILIKFCKRSKFADNKPIKVEKETIFIGCVAQTFAFLWLNEPYLAVVNFVLYYVLYHIAKTINKSLEGVNL